jgi:hypothetical protein
MINIWIISFTIKRKGGMVYQIIFMKKLLMLLVATLVSVVMYAQIGIGYTEAKVRTFIQTSDKVETKDLDSGYKLLKITKDNIIAGYIFYQDTCIMYILVPKSSQVCDDILEYCNAKYDYLGNETWRYATDKKRLIIHRIFQEEINEHMYIYEEEKDSNL